MRLINELRGFLRDENFRPPLRPRGGAGAMTRSLGLRKGGTVHGGTLIYFLISCNQLSSEPFLRGLDPQELARGAAAIQVRRSSPRSSGRTVSSG